MKRTPLAAVAAALLVLSACALTRLEAPQLSLAEVKILGGDLWEQRLQVRVHVVNPNDRALPIKALEYTVEVEGQQFASGASTASFVVPPLGESDFDMNVTTNLGAALLKLAGRSAGAAGDVGYRLTGKVTLSEGLLRTVPFDQKGTFRLH